MNLNQIVREMLIEVGENTLHKFPRFLQYGISGLREMNLDVSGTPKLVELKVNPNNTVDLPLDYIAFIKLAICKDGVLHHLGFNKNLCVHTDNCGDTIASESGLFNGIVFGHEGGHFRNGESVGRHFGIGGGTNRNGYYKIKERDGYIILNGFTGASIFLEYLADIERNEDGSFEIHPYIVEALKAFIAWKHLQRNIRIPGNAKEQARRDYITERGRSQRRFASFTKEEVLQTIRKTFSLAPKF